MKTEELQDERGRDEHELGRVEISLTSDSVDSVEQLRLHSRCCTKSKDSTMNTKRRCSREERRRERTNKDQLESSQVVSGRVNNARNSPLLEPKYLRRILLRIPSSTFRASNLRMPSDKVHTELKFHELELDLQISQTQVPLTRLPRSRRLLPPPRILKRTPFILHAGIPSFASFSLPNLTASDQA